MFEGFKLTRAEHRSIDRGWSWLTENTRDTHRSHRFMLDETSGYGNRNDRVPQMAAKGMCLSWVRQGVIKPDVLLRDFYSMHPAAIWFQGMGAERSSEVIANIALLTEAVLAYDAAFKRMIDLEKVVVRDVVKREVAGRS